jgi:hypothetical protein
MHNRRPPLLLLPPQGVEAQIPGRRVPERPVPRAKFPVVDFNGHLPTLDNEETIRQGWPADGND